MNKFAGRTGTAMEGSELSGKHILLWGEQGIGDELIFFLSLVNFKADKRKLFRRV